MLKYPEHGAPKVVMIVINKLTELHFRYKVSIANAVMCLSSVSVTLCPSRVRNYFPIDPT